MYFSITSTKVYKKYAMIFARKTLHSKTPVYFHTAIIIEQRKRRAIEKVIMSIYFSMKNNK